MRHANRATAAAGGYRQWSTCSLSGGGVLVLLLGQILLTGCASSWSGSSNDAPPAFGQSYPGDEEGLASTPAPRNLTETVKQVTGQGNHPQRAREIYAEATELYAAALRQRQADPNGKWQSDLNDAGDTFRDAAKKWTDSALEQDALFRAAESYFFANEYPEANEAFEQLLKRYPNSKYIDLVAARRFSIAKYWLEYSEAESESFYDVNALDVTRPWHDTRGHAMRVFEQLPIDDPTGKLADDAIMSSGIAHFKAGRYLTADTKFEDLRKTFPNSEHQFMAHLMGIKSKLLAYQGPNYAGDALDEAVKLVEQVNRQFPVEAQQNREMLDKAYRELRYRKAEREWTLAKYFDWRHEYGAARFYYNLVMTDYSDTPFNDRALQRMQRIVDEPDAPPQRLAWLVKLFPDSEPARPLLTGNSTVVR